MQRTQIQLPDELYRRAKRFAAEREMSLAEVIRRSLESFLERYPKNRIAPEEWKFPVLEGGESNIPLEKALGRLLRDEDWETRAIPKTLARAGAWVQDAMPWGEDAFIKPFMIDRADDHYELDINRARTLLGWEPKHRLRDTLPLMIQALEADPVAWYQANKLPAPARLLKRSA